MSDNKDQFDQLASILDSLQSASLKGNRSILISSEDCSILLEYIDVLSQDSECLAVMTQNQERSNA